MVEIGKRNQAKTQMANLPGTAFPVAGISNSKTFNPL